MSFDQWFRAVPIIAIVRGIAPQEVVATGNALFAAGIRVVEVPLNSPQPLKSISLLADAFRGRMTVGAGTVLRADAVDDIKAAGGEIIVAPNTDPAVIGRARDRGLEPIPGFATATEAFAAVHAGARYLKLFPAGNFGPSYVKALAAVLPEAAHLIAVGGVSAPTLAQWWEAGVKGFGIGSELYRPGQSPEDTARAAIALMSAFSRLTRRPV